MIINPFAPGCTRFAPSGVYTLWGTHHILAILSLTKKLNWSAETLNKLLHNEK